jgi:hypothetical protein
VAEYLALVHEKLRTADELYDFMIEQLHQSQGFFAGNDGGHHAGLSVSREMRVVELQRVRTKWGRAISQNKTRIISTVWLVTSITRFALQLKPKQK